MRSTVRGVSTYDALPYADYCFARTHPSHLAAMLSLAGYAAPPLDGARVLEIGCARGANLLPMALDLPTATCVGIDPSRSQIDEATQRARDAAITNVRFVEGSIDDEGALDGTFDYVLCHGVYSWVPAAVREATLRRTRALLAPGGVAYVSFNALPGWNALRTLREYLAAHVDGRAPPTLRVAQARGALAVLSRALHDDRSPLGRWTRDELDALADTDDAYLFHEYLADENGAFYWRNFVGAAARSGLRFVCDADPSLAAPTLRDGAPLGVLQSMDFVQHRRFHAAVLVPEETPAGRHDPAAIVRLCLASDETRARASAEDRWMAALFESLDGEGRRPLAFGVLAGRVGAALGLDRAGAMRAAVAHVGALLARVCEGSVTVHARPATWAAEVSTTPMGSPLARSQCAAGDTLTTLRHTRLAVGETERAVLALLDGTRTVDDVARAMGEATQGAVDAARTGEALAWLARNALLVR